MPKVLKNSDFASTVVAWQRQSGRHDLPWQNTRDPYKVWLSEIMLQQTQVVTVKVYFEKFLRHFPTVADLAGASQQDVLGLWSGLGYYSRARNMHRAAQMIVELHGEQFPQTAQELQSLPGIGRSTAAAIASVCFGERVAILDGNVKRVLSRWLGFDLDLASARHERTLWEKAQTLLPQKNLEQTMPIYTQGMMDLGAMICSSRKPECSLCPLVQTCVAHAQGEPTRYPVKTRKIKRSTQSLWLLWVEDGKGQVLLCQRPQQGVWAGLHVFPWFDSESSLQEAVPTRWRAQMEAMDVVKHVLTHRDLYLHPMRLRVQGAATFKLLMSQAVRSDELHLGQWWARQQWETLGLPAPIRQLLSQG
jgi:A/G-specific adenine glycosylase